MAPPPGTVQRMLVLRVELWPGGNPGSARELGRVGMANVSRLAPVSDYVCVVVDDAGGERSVLVRGHKRAAGFWALIARALDFGGAEAVPIEHLELVSAVHDRLVTEP